MNNWLIFLLLFVLSFASLFVSNHFSMVGADESRFVFDAMQMEKGKWPVADHTTRGPLLLVLIYLSSNIFGPSLLAFRLPVLLITAFTTAFLFLLGKDLFSKRVGVVAAIIFALNPYTLWNNLILKTETSTIVYIVIASLFLIKAFKQERWYFYGLAGVFTGVAYIERHSALAFMITLALTTAYHVWACEELHSFWSYMERVLKKSLLLLCGVVVGFGSIFGIFAVRNFQNSATVWLTPFFIDTVLEHRPTYSDPIDKIWHFLREWALVFNESIAVQGWILYPAFIIFVITGILSATFFTRRVKYIFAMVVGIVFCGSLLFHSFHIYFIGYFRPFVFLFLAIFSIIYLWSFYWYRNEIEIEEHYKEHTQSIFFLVCWIFGLVIAYSLFYTGYHRELVPPLTLMAAFIMSFFKKKHFVSLLGVSLVGLYGMSVSWFLDAPTGGWWWRQETISGVTRYIEYHTTPGEDIFTANTLPVYMADREVFGNITSYSMRFARDPHSHWGTFPSPVSVFERLQKYPPRYVLIDGRMERHIFQVHPFFEEFVRSRYKLAASFGNRMKNDLDWTEVWELKK